MSTALVCKHCDAPLPPPGEHSPFIVCSYCGTTHTVAPPRMELAPKPPGPTEDDRIRAAAPVAWDEARAHSKDPVVAVRAVVAVHAGELSDEREAERAARLAESLLKGFDAAHGTKTLFDKMAAIRVAEAAVRAVIYLRQEDETEINLPFLTATGQGPLHLNHAMTKQALEHLDQLGEFRVEEVEEPPASAPAAPEASPPRKRRWWPFGK